MLDRDKRYNENAERGSMKNKTEQKRLWLLPLVVVALSASIDNSTPGTPNAGPSLLNVKEIVIQNPRIGNPRAADMCSLSQQDFLNSIDRTMKTDNVPAVLINKAKPGLASIARIDVIPEIVAIDNAVQNKTDENCTTWVSLVAQTQNVLVVPPVETPRSVVVTYWRSGLIVQSPQTSHNRLVNETLQKLTRDFDKQYQVAQPPDLQMPVNKKEAFQ